MAEGTKIRFRTIIEVLGKPKEHIETALKGYVEKIKEDSDLMVMHEDFAEAAAKGDLWSAFVELEVIANDVPKLIGFCFDYMPSTLEIIKPEEFLLKDRVISDFLNDLQARLHKVDMAVKQLKMENEFLKKNMQTLVKNIVLISLTKNSLSLEKLSRAAGIPEQEIKSFLDKLIKEEKIKKDGDIYSLI
jgi:hypothetical protein